MGSPCIDVCRFDEDTGWMTRKNKKAWKKDKTARPAILETLPARLAAMEALGLAVGKAARKKGDKRKGD
ncbi:MAG: DUF1289 domain-containing protein [Acetobacteraceae bacterium]|nr:DUF1289 domain-containing protein [Acetobacteraceae bacterium]